MASLFDYTDFNSIKVRLKLQVESEIEGRVKFQFHKGTIKTYHLIYRRLNVYDFNSIKVRLKPPEMTAKTTENDISIP